MASPARIAKALPATLPADFGEWDESHGSPQADEPAAAEPAAEPNTEGRPAAAPPAQAEAARSRIPAPQPRVFTNEKAFLDQLLGMNLESGTLNRISAQPGAIFEVAPLPHASPRPKSDRPARAGRTPREAETPSPVPRKAASAQAAPVHDPLPAARGEADPEAAFALLVPGRLAGRKKPIVALAAGAASVLLLLLFLAFALGRSGRRTAAPPAQPASPAAYSTENAAMPSPAAQSSAAAPNAAAAQPDAASQGADAAATTAQPADAAAPPQVQSQMMNDQLNAPARISAEMKARPADDAPPAALDASGLGGSAAQGAVLSATAAPQVKVAPPQVVNVSAGVAIGLLIQSTPPIYPNIARTARVAGTVVLEATISKSGAIENLRAVSGPAMLRQAALDAVRTWRYRPYKVNNEPTAIQTSINVVFKLQ